MFVGISNRDGIRGGDCDSFEWTVLREREEGEKKGKEFSRLL